MTLPPCFDAVFFDLDGTLVATDRFWIESADRGARQAFERLGLRRALPTPSQWLSLVGLPLEVGFRALFPELSDSERRTVLTACVDEEEAMLRRGGVPAMPGTLDVVHALRERGLALGIASNCQRSYLEHMLDGLGLRALVGNAYCRESPGIDSKADMLACLLADVGTRSALMVGDRSSDRDAAWENGLPHVHCAFGFAQGDEGVEAEGRIASLSELPALLERRGRWIERTLARLGGFRRPGLRLGITGRPAAGKTLFARDAARVLRARGIAVAAVSLADFATGKSAAGDDPLEDTVDLQRLQHELLRVHEAGREVQLAAPDLLGQRVVPPGAVLILEGAHLLGARLRVSLDRLVHLDVPETVSLRRLRGRDGRYLDPSILARTLEADLRIQRARERRFPPRVSSDLVLDGTNPFGSEAPGPFEANAGFAKD